jgi:hypothetical protein
VVPTTVVVVVGGVVVVVVGSMVVVVVGGVVVVVVGSMVVVVVGGSVVVVVDASIVVDVVLVVAGAVVVVTGAAIAPLLMDRSWLPTEQFLSEHTKSMRRMWYGDPLIDEAEFPVPQSVCDAMWPDQESTIVGAEAVKYTVVEAVLVPANVPVCEYAVGLDARVQLVVPHRSPEFAMLAPLAGNVPPSMRIDWAATCVTPAAVTRESMGMGRVDTGVEHVMPAHPSAVVSVRATDVR